MTSTIKKSLSSFLAVCMIFGLFFVLDQPITANAAEALSNVSTISTMSVQKGQSVQVNAMAKGGTGFYQYAAYSKLSSATAWTTEQGYGANSIIMVAFDSTGSYDVRVAVKDSNGEVATKDFVVSVGSSSLANNSTLSATSVALGDSVKVNAKASGGTAPYLYGVYYKKTSSDKWSTAQAYKSNATVSFKPGAATTYDVKVKVKDGAGKIVAKSFKVTVTKALSNTSSVSSELISLGQNVTVTCGATGGKTPYLFGVYYKLTTVENFSTLQAYNSNKTVTFTPKKTGTYDIKTKVKDAAGKIVSQSFKLSVTGTSALTNTSSFSASKITLGNPVTIKASATGGSAPYQYAVYYRSAEVTTWKTVQSYKENSTIKYKPTLAGDYEFCVKVKDSKGTIVKKYYTVTAITDIVNNSSLSAASISTNDTLTISCSATGGTGYYQYAVYQKKTSETEYITVREYSSATSYTLTFSETGDYDLCVKAKDSNGAIVKKYFKLTVTGGHSGTKYDIVYYVDLNDSYLQKLNIVNDNPAYYYSGDGLDLKDLIVEGYTFEGWFTKQSGGTLVETIPAGTTGKKTLYAHWTKEPYTINFDSPLVPYNDTNSLTRYISDTTSLKDLKWDGYIFVGWSDDNGNIIKSVKPGTTDITVHANWMSERNKAWAKKDVGDPIIVNSEETNSILFVYEIGRIDNVPLQVIKDFGYINSEGVTRTISEEYSVKTDVSLMEQYTQTIANSTTNTAQWSLSRDWTDSVTVSENYLKENNLSETDAKTLCTTDNENWLISSGTAGATTTTTYDSAQEYDLNTATGNTKTYDTHDSTNSKTHKQSADLKFGAKEYAEVSGGANIGVGHIEGKAGVELNQELALGYEGSRTKSSSDKTGTESDQGNQDQTGSIKHTGTDTVSNTSWNNSSSYGGSKTVSNTDSVSKTVSERIASEYGYGKSYIGHEGETNIQGTSSSLSNSKAYSSAVTYSTEESKKETITYTTSNTKTGFHRLIRAGTAHVFAIVGYDIKTASYYVTTYTVMDDEFHDFEDYSYSTSRYDDNQISVIPFEVPYEVEEYVLSMVGESEGLEFNKSGKVTGYHGTEKTVIIPEYHVFDNQDGTKSVIKVTGITETAFKNNKDIIGIELSDYITEIPSSAFEGCTELSLVNMTNVISIGAKAFKGCENLDTVYLSQKVENIGVNAFENLDTFAVYTNKLNVINGAINSGAKKIVIIVCDSCDELNSAKFTVGDGTEIFVFHGRGNTFNNLAIDSNASTTVINNVTINSTFDVPLKVASSEVQLGQVTINSSGISIILSNDNCVLDLYGESEVHSATEDAMLCKNVDVVKTSNASEQGAFTELAVYDNVLVCGSITNKSLVNFHGEIREINEEKFAKYAKGVFLISFDANGGTVSVASQQAYYGQTYGTLPTPTRSNYNFDGWYTAASGGTKVTSSTTVTAMANHTLYAHWSPKQYTVYFNGNGGAVGTPSKTVTYNSAYGTLPSAQRDYYDFAGWYTAASGGTRIYDSTVFTGSSDITLYAHWNQHSVSGWVRRDSMPASAQVVNTKWTYTEKSYKDSRNASESGYTLSSSEWVWSGSESKYYASFPSGFDTGNWYYQNWNGGAYGGYENNTSKRVVSNSWAGFIYWHWMYNCGEANANPRAIWNQSGICPVNGYGYWYFGAFNSTADYPVQGYNQYCNNCGMTTYKDTGRTSYADSQGSHYWFRFDYYVSKYDDYYKLFHYYKEENKESYSKPTASSTVYNIVEWVQYRAK